MAADRGSVVCVPDGVEVDCSIDLSDLRLKSITL